MAGVECWSWLTVSSPVSSKHIQGTAVFYSNKAIGYFWHSEPSPSLSPSSSIQKNCHTMLWLWQASELPVSLFLFCSKICNIIMELSMSLMIGRPPRGGGSTTRGAKVALVARAGYFIINIFLKTKKTPPPPPKKMQRRPNIAQNVGNFSLY